MTYLPETVPDTACEEEPQRPLHASMFAGALWKSNHFLPVIHQNENFNSTCAHVPECQDTAKGTPTPTDYSLLRNNFSSNETLLGCRHENHKWLQTLKTIPGQFSWEYIEIYWKDILKGCNILNCILNWIQYIEYMQYIERILGISWIESCTWQGDQKTGGKNQTKIQTSGQQGCQLSHWGTMAGASTRNLPSPRNGLPALLAGGQVIGRAWDARHGPNGASVVGGRCSNAGMYLPLMKMGRRGLWVFLIYMPNICIGSGERQECHSWRTVITLAKGNGFSRKEVSLVYEMHPPVLSIFLEIWVATLLLTCLEPEAVPHTEFYDVCVTITQIFFNDFYWVSRGRCPETCQLSLFSTRVNFQRGIIEMKKFQENFDWIGVRTF